MLTTPVNGTVRSDWFSETLSGPKRFFVFTLVPTMIGLTAMYLRPSSDSNIGAVLAAAGVLRNACLLMLCPQKGKASLGLGGRAHCPPNTNRSPFPKCSPYSRRPRG